MIQISDQKKFYELEGQRVVMFKDYTFEQRVFELKRYLFFLFLVQKSFKKQKTIKILDLGCGDGYLLNLLKQSGYKNLYGVDISKTRVKRALELTKLPNKHIVASLGEKTPFLPNFFDVIICSEVMEHIPKPDLLLKEIHRLLKDEGMFIISTPNEEKLKFKRCVHCQKLITLTGHLHSFSITSVKKKLKDTNLIFHNGYFLAGNIRPFIFFNGIINKMPFGIFYLINNLIVKNIKKRN